MLQYIAELKLRVIKSLLVFAVVFAICFIYSEALYTTVAMPLIKQLPHGSTLIATKVTSTFVIPMNVSFIIATLFCMPFLLHQAWSFIAPALYQHEKRAASQLLCASTVLFYLGVAFAFFVLCPMALSFFAQCTPVGVTLMADIGHYLDFITTMLVATGLAFQIPVIIRVLIRCGIIGKDTLINKRPYIIVLAFVLGMLLTPPDVVSQILLALPIWALFEVGLLTA